MPGLPSLTSNCPLYVHVCVLGLVLRQSCTEVKNVWCKKAKLSFIRRLLCPSFRMSWLSLTNFVALDTVDPQYNDLSP